MLTFTHREIIDLLKAFVGVSIAFWLLYGGFKNILALPVIAIIVGFAFILHELAHKAMATYYGYDAEFYSFDKMILASILMSFLGFLFLAPGAVMIAGVKKMKHLGIISIVGPLTNVALALLSLVLVPWLGGIAKFSFVINTWLALFNMIPFMGLDGEKVLAWNKVVYAVTMIIVGVLYLSSYV